MAEKKKTETNGIAKRGAPKGPRVPKAPINGETVNVGGMNLDFGAKGRGSVYDKELDALVAASKAAENPATVARKFPDGSVRTALVLRAKIRKIPIEVAVGVDGLYVRLASAPAEQTA